VYFITLAFLVRKIFTFYINDVLLFKCPFPGPKGYTQNACFDSLYNFVRNSFHSENIRAMYYYKVLYHEPVTFVRLIKLEFPRRIFEKYPHIKFHKIPSSGSRVVPCGRTDGQTDMTKLTVAFRNVVKITILQNKVNLKNYVNNF